MSDKYFHDETFIKLSSLSIGEYENCVFDNCDFSNSDISGINLVECIFTNCNLSLVKLNKTSLQNIQFKYCKIMGVRFDTCNPFGLSISFHNCQLNHSSFYKLKLKKTIFTNCHLQETDFTEADLSNAVFENCNLMQAIFLQTNLEKVDFRTAYNYSIDSERNTMKKAKFAIAGVIGLLHKYDILID